VSTEDVYNDLISSIHWEASKKSQMDLEGDNIFANGGDDENESNVYDSDMSRDRDSSPNHLESSSSREFSDGDAASSAEFEWHQRELLSKILITRGIIEVLV
jgi:hypothetical protein